MHGSIGQKQGSLLLVLTLQLHQENGRLFIETQAGNGLVQWLEHFSRMTLVCKIAHGTPPGSSVAVDDLGLSGRLDIFTLPSAWTPIAFARAYSAARRRLAELIDNHDYLQFAIGGAWGDWPTVGALIAAKKGRAASVWADRVESEVMRIDAGRYKGLRRLYRWTNSRIAKWLEERVIARTTLGLFHGRDTFSAYQGMSQNPHLVHNIHLKPTDRISAKALDAKIARVGEEPLNIVYAGRLHPDKGVMDWIETLRLTDQAGVDFRASWFGEGPLLEGARLKVQQLGLDSRIFFPGPALDRQILLERLRAAHLMLFCHLTPESPRCLIEALVSGTPIVGYGSGYSEDLIAENGGGKLTPMKPAALAETLVGINDNRARLASLIADAARDGRDMNDAAVFAHRSDLMKRFCPPDSPSALKRHPIVQPAPAPNHVLPIAERY